MDIKPIETEYKGYLFRSRLEARWAVFFDACGVKWEYEPEGFYCGDGVLYLPDFLLHDVLFRDSNVPKDLWVEVKGVMTEDDARKISKFAAVGVDKSNTLTGEVQHPILVVTKIPDEDEVNDTQTFFQKVSYGEGEVQPFNFSQIDGDFFGAFPCINKQGRLVIEDDNRRCAGGKDEEATIAAYSKARQARFEHKMPTVTDPEHIKNLLSLIEPAKCDYYKWLTILQSVKNSLTANGVDDETAFEIFDEWCARDNSVNPKGKPRYNRAHNKKAWDSMTKYRFGINTLEKTAEKFSYRAVAD